MRIKRDFINTFIAHYFKCVQNATTLRDATVAPTSEVSTITMLLLATRWGASSEGTSFVQTGRMIQKLKQDTQKHTPTHTS